MEQQTSVARTSLPDPFDDQGTQSGVSIILFIRSSLISCRFSFDLDGQRQNILLSDSFRYLC